MDENRLSGTARNLGGKAEEGVGRLTGDVKTQLRESSTRRPAPPRISTARARMPRARQL